MRYSPSDASGLGMLFSSYPFLLIFLPLTLIGYYLACRGEAARTWFLIAASTVFYGYWDVRLVPLLVASIVANWLLADWYHQRRRRAIITLAIAGNLVVLAVFKYLDFFIDSIDEISGARLPLLHIVLPLGISFFTFHHIIYLVDCVERNAPRYRFRDYALYIALFPQILAGPLVRHSEIVHQFRLDPRRAGAAERIGRGLTLLVIGLAKKVLLADTLAGIANPLFQAARDGAPLDALQGWTGALGFTFQIYFDFSGYSDMAIGLALMLGFALPINFDAPYRASDLRDFWRRWHMTLSRFLRDYLYIELGGNRHGLPRQLAALLVTMLLGGLWHGAGWSFVVWGGLHGVGLAAGVLWRRAGRRLPAVAAWPLTFLFLVATWVFFRAGSLSAAMAMRAAMVSGSPFAGGHPPFLLAVAAAIAIVGPKSQDFAAEIRPRPALSLVAAAASLLLLLKLGGGGSYEFIYFRF
jgi:D-alanyl-lipoteichoic acid acyltransferase DltB (MBOAT superfamily)